MLLGTLHGLLLVESLTFRYGTALSSLPTVFAHLPSPKLHLPVECYRSFPLSQAMAPCLSGK